jgi:hypothetical protein
VRPGAEKSKSTSSSRDTQLTLREQLVSYYTKRALEVLWMCGATLWNSLHLLQLQQVHDIVPVDFRFLKHLWPLLLQGFPGLTPFEGLVAGAGAIARQLPPGSPATVYFLKSFVEKTESLYSADGDTLNVEQNEGKQAQTGLPGDISDPHKGNSKEEAVSAAQKLQILLLHMCLLVDLQV